MVNNKYTQRQKKKSYKYLDSDNLEIYIIQLYRYLYMFMFLVNHVLVWRDKTVPKPWNYGAHDAHAFMFFAVFKNLKSSFSENNI